MIFTPLWDEGQFKECINVYIKMHKDYAPDSTSIVLIGMIDPHKNRRVSYNEAIIMAKEYNIGFYSECCAITGENIESTFEAAVEYVIEYSGLRQLLDRPYTSSTRLEACRVPSNCAIKTETESDLHDIGTTSAHSAQQMLDSKLLAINRSQTIFKPPEILSDSSVASPQIKKMLMKAIKMMH